MSTLTNHQNSTNDDSWTRITHEYNNMNANMRRVLTLFSGHCNEATRMVNVVAVYAWMGSPKTSSDWGLVKKALEDAFLVNADFFSPFVNLTHLRSIDFAFQNKNAYCVRLSTMFPRTLFVFTRPEGDMFQYTLVRYSRNRQSWVLINAQAKDGTARTVSINGLNTILKNGTFGALANFQQSNIKYLVNEGVISDTFINFLM